MKNNNSSTYEKLHDDFAKLSWQSRDYLKLEDSVSMSLEMQSCSFYTKFELECQPNFGKRPLTRPPLSLSHSLSLSLSLSLYHKSVRHCPKSVCIVTGCITLRVTIN